MPFETQRRDPGKRGPRGEMAIANAGAKGAPGMFGSGAFNDAVTLLVTFRVVLGLLAVYLWWTATLPGPCHFELARNGWTTIPPLADQGPSFPLIGVWQRWDACWYTKVATYGYESGTDSATFWPLFPLLTGVVGRILAGSMALGGLVVTGIAYVLAMTGLERLIARDFDAAIAWRTLIAISIWPAAFFFFAPFTESVFLATTVWAVLAARERHWALAALAAGLASLTRIQGLFLVLPLAWEAAMTWRELHPDTRRSLGAAARGMAIPAIAVALPIVGFVGFVAFATAATGTSTLDAQDAWGGRNFHAPWEVAAASLQWALDHQDPLQLLNLIGLAGFSVLLIFGVRRLPIAYTLLAAPQLLLLATRIQPTPLTGTLRYLVVVFPVFVLLGQVGDRRLQFGWALGSSLFLALLAARFFGGEFVA